MSCVLVLYVWATFYCIFIFCLFFFFFKQKTAYEMRISDWSSDVCSSDLEAEPARGGDAGHVGAVTVAVGHEGHVGEVGQPGQVGGERQVGVEIGRASCRERVCQYV